MKHYFSTTGRTGRIEYITCLVLCPFLLGTIDYFTQLFSSDIVPFNIVLVVTSIVGLLATCWVFFTAVIRRMHDLNFSGWWLFLVLLLAFIILAMGLILPLFVALGCGKMLLCFCPGDKKKNKFGERPDLFGGFVEETKNTQTHTLNTSRINFKL